ncbi:MAG: hypothetical protein EAZ99_15780, partial [Alphaproteobacteria bacterium]
LRLLNPFMPFITEELWGEGQDLLLQASWPSYDAVLCEGYDKKMIEWCIEVITNIRSTRALYNVPPSAFLRAWFLGDKDQEKQYSESGFLTIKRLARLREFELSESAPTTSIQIELPNCDSIFLDLGQSIDVAAEKARLSKEIDRQTKDLAKLDGKLRNADFRAKADPAVIEDTEKRAADLRTQIVRLTVAVARLSAM